uniref:C2H2-type domain-containing protein n=1 Tax=Hucho hucho TaxID=62062 RepID=A0A4W5KHC2_9TELE
MTGIAAASFFSNSCRFGGCGLQFESLAELIVHIEDNHIVTHHKTCGNELNMRLSRKNRPNRMINAIYA